MTQWNWLWRRIRKFKPSIGLCFRRNSWSN